MIHSERTENQHTSIDARPSTNRGTKSSSQNPVLACLVTGLTLTWPVSSLAGRVEPNVAKYEEGHIEVLNKTHRLPSEARDPLSIRLAAFSREFVLNLVKSNILADDARTLLIDDTGAHEIPTKNFSYMGTVEGDVDSIVRISLVGGSLKGIIQTSEGTFALEPLKRYDPSAPSRLLKLGRLEERAGVLSFFRSPGTAFSSDSPDTASRFEG